MTRPPNLIVIMTDQQRYDAMTCHGGAARTPHLDRLAAESVDLHRHYAQAPVCVPSRSVMFTGLYPQATGVFENNVRVPTEALAPFRQLKASGYQLAYFGKDHFFPQEATDLLDHYDECHPPGDHPASAGMQALIAESRRRLEEIGCHASGMFHDFPDEVTTTGVTGARVVDFLRTASSEQPFFLVASFHDPHVPHVAPRRFAADHPPEKMPLPTSGPESLETKHPRYTIKRLAQQPNLATAADFQRYKSVYNAMIAYVDEQIGRILEALEGRADAEDTLIIFTSDHGDFNGNHGMVKKDLVHIEDLLHVPFCVRLPGKRQAGRQVHALTEHVDLFPTLLDYAGVATNEPLHGTSLRPLLEGETETHKEAIFATVCPPGARNPYPDFRSFRAAWEAAQKDPAPHPLKYTRPYNVPGDHTRSIRTDRWRYVDYVDGFEELYDLAADPLETRNIASDPENSGVLDELRARLADHVEKHAVSTPAS